MPQQVAYILFPPREGAPNRNAEDRDVADIPHSINIRRNTPIDAPRALIVGEDYSECRIAVLMGHDLGELRLVNLARITRPSNLAALRPVFFQLLREPAN
jgi:hypothetical protein